jgi:hypothetical protein
MPKGKGLQSLKVLATLKGNKVKIFVLVDKGA